MKKNLLLTTLLSASVFTAAFAQEPVDQAIVQKIREEGLNHSQVMKTAFYLTDVSGPRLAGSPGLKHAQDWAVSQLKTWGMANVGLEAWGKFGKGWEVEKNYAAITVPYYHAIIAIPKAWTPGTAGPIKGDVVLIKADTITDLDQYKGKLKGKIVITDTKTALTRSTKPDLSRYTDEELEKMAAAQPAQPGDRRGGGPNSPAFAAMRKLRALRAAMSEFFVQEQVGLVLSQARGTDGTVFTTNGASYAEDAKPVAPELETSGEDYLRIVRLLNAGITVQMEADVQTQFFDKDLQGYDVVAEIPGTDKKLKDQLVLSAGTLIHGMVVPALQITPPAVL